MKEPLFRRRGFGKMPKAVFYIEGKQVQDVGLRIVLTEKILHAGFAKGGVFNLPDGRVEVVLEDADAEKITSFHKKVEENLVAWLESSAENKERLKRLIGNPGIRVSKIEFNDKILVLDVGLYSHSLELNQLSKGIDVYYDLMESLKEFRTAIAGLQGAVNGVQAKL